MKRNVLKKITGIVLATVIAVLVIRVFMDITEKYNRMWQDCYVEEARKIYNAGGNLLNIELPEHTLRGFPICYYSTSVIIVSLLLFCVIRFCFGAKIKYSVLCSVILLVVMAIPITLSAMDYYNKNYKENVEYLYGINHNIWWQEDASNVVQMVEVDGKLYVVDTE